MFDLCVLSHTKPLARATLRNHSGKRQNNSVFGKLQSLKPLACRNRATYREVSRWSVGAAACNDQGPGLVEIKQQLLDWPISSTRTT